MEDHYPLTQPDCHGEMVDYDEDGVDDMSMTRKKISWILYKHVEHKKFFYGEKLFL
jgi:hypothetical protein